MSARVAKARGQYDPHVGRRKRAKAKAIAKHRASVEARRRRFEERDK